MIDTENYSGYFGVQRSASGEPRPDFGFPSGIFATRQMELGTRLTRPGARQRVLRDGCPGEIRRVADSAGDAAPLRLILETEADGSGNLDKSKIH